MLLVTHVLVDPGRHLVGVTASTRCGRIVAGVRELVPSRVRVRKLHQHSLGGGIDVLRAYHVQHAVATDPLARVSEGIRGQRVVDRDQIAVSVTIIGEVAALLRQGRYTLREGLAKSQPETFVAEKEEGLVAPIVEMGKVEGPADIAAELVLMPRSSVNPLGVVKEIVGVQHVVAQVFISGAVKLIAAGFRGEVDDAAGKTAPLRVQVIRLHLEFLKRILGGNQAELIDVAVVQRHAVEVFRALIGDGATNLVVGVIERILPHRSALGMPLGHDAGRERDQVHGVASVERQLIHLPLRDDLTQVSRGGLKQGRLGCHLNRLGHLSEFHAEVDPG